MASNPFSFLATADFAAALQKLLPPGAAYPGPLSAPVQAGALAAFADQQFALHARAIDLLDTESDPAFTLELLPDFEAEFGLPDPCTPLNPTVEQRRIALLGKIAAIGGQSDAYLIAVAAAMGFAITITHLAASKAGIAVAGSPLRGPNCDFTMVIATTQVRIIWSVAGQAHAGDPIDFVDNTQLQCRLAAIAPGDNYLLFQYS